MRVRKTPIAWFGGKTAWADWIVSHLPQHRAYCEVFGGSAAVLFAKKPSPIEIYNDLDEGLVTFYRALADPDQCARMLDHVWKIPYSRHLYRAWRTGGWQDHPDPAVRAARWFYVAQASFSAQFGGSWSFGSTSSARGMEEHVNKWVGSWEALPAFHQRWLRVSVDQDDWSVILDRYDAPSMLFYLDPPYVPETRKKGQYAHELTTDDHRRLVARLLTLQGMAVLSGYDSPVYAPLMHAGWHQERRVGLLHADRVKHRTGQTRAKRVECLWINPSALAARHQLTLWGGSPILSRATASENPVDPLTGISEGGADAHDLSRL